jgi:hypothetical protein
VKYKFIIIIELETLIPKSQTQSNSMEGMLSPTDQQTLVSSFLEVAQGQTAATARQFLQVHITSIPFSSSL